MFKRIREGMRVARTGVEVHKIIDQEYAHNVDLHRLHSWIEAGLRADENPHDLAIAYVTDQVLSMTPGNLTHARHAEIWISAAREAIRNGRATNVLYLKKLESTVKLHHGIAVA